MATRHTPGRQLSKQQEEAMLEREKIVLNARIRGVPFAQIERDHGIVNAARVHRRALERDGNDSFRRAEATRLEELRLDTLQDGIWDKAISGDSRAVEVALKILERRAKMNGLDFADMISGQLVEIEQAKVRVMAAALVTAMNSVDGLTAEQKAAMTGAFFAELRAAAAVDTPAALSPADEDLL